MKVRIIGGIRQIDDKDPLCGLWLEFVRFPMVVTNREAEHASDPHELRLYNENELRQWANKAFDEDGYQIWEMEVPVTGTRPALELVSQQKDEYERAAASTPEAQGERDAVIAARDTLQVHLGTWL